MAVKIKFDNQNVAESPTIVLLKRNGEKLGVLQAKEIHFTGNMNSAQEITFRVYKEDNGKKTNLWDDIRNFRLVWCKEWNLVFEISVEIDESDETVKSVSGTSLAEVELSNTKLFGIEVNTEDDIASDDYIPTLIYRADASKKRGSLLDRLLSKIPIYSVKYIDESIANLQRTFTFNDTSVYDAFQEIAQEINCIFIFNSSLDNNGNITRTFSVYDLESYCLECGHRDEFIGDCPNCGSSNVKHGYGDDTNIIITTDNLADDIGFSTDIESVKNCFRLEAGDDLMTDTIANVNPNGSRYIWFITDETKEDMSDELTDLLNSYDESYAYYQDEYAPTNIQTSVVSKYNELVTKYREYDSDLPLMPTLIGYSSIMEGYYDAIDFRIYLQSGLMPSITIEPTTAEQEAAKITSSALSPVAVNNLAVISTSTASSAVLSVAKTLISPKYRIKVASSGLSGNQWVGSFTLTNYSDEEDTAQSATIAVNLTESKQKYLEQRIAVVLNQKVEESSDIVDLFNMSLTAFTAEIKKYCLARLNSFHDSCQSCLDILLEQGVADPDKWGSTSTGLYNTMYLPYYNKLLALESEIQLRESEIAAIDGTYDQYGSLTKDGMISELQDAILFVQDELNFQEYIGEYWDEFISFRREDVYSNSNYISDGLSNSEIIKQANEFLEMANKEIYKSATQQHSLTSSLRNLLVMKEFKPIVDYFEIGNWIRVKIDDKIYRLRLINYDIDFDNISDLSVSFSDVRETVNGLTDAESIMNQAKSMASSYGYVSHQASQGEKSKGIVDGWTRTGLDMTKLKIIDNADNQEITWDSHGLLCREYYPELDSYSDKQLKMINTGIYLTDNSWQSSKTAIGNFYYKDPETGDLVEAYGVNGETLIGTLILGEQLGIYNEDATLKFNHDGLYITNGVNTFVVNPNSSSRMIALSKDSSDLLTVDEYGNLIIVGNITARTLKIGYDDINLYADSTGISIRDNTTTLAHFGVSGTQIYQNSGKLVVSISGGTASKAALTFYNGTSSAASGNDVMATFNKSGVSLFSYNETLSKTVKAMVLSTGNIAFYGTDGETILAEFGINGAQIGKTASSHMNIGEKSISATADGDTSPYFLLENMADASVTYTYTYSASDMEDWQESGAMFYIVLVGVTAVEGVTANGVALTDNDYYFRSSSGRLEIYDISSYTQSGVTFAVTQVLGSSAGKSFTFGTRTSAGKGAGSVSFGVNNSVNKQAFAFGVGLDTGYPNVSENGLFVGKYNRTNRYNYFGNRDYLLLLGNGTSSSNRSDAASIDKYGNMELAGGLKSGGELIGNRCFGQLTASTVSLSSATNIALTSGVTGVAQGAHIINYGTYLTIGTTGYYKLEIFGFWSSIGESVNLAAVPPVVPKRVRWIGIGTVTGTTVSEIRMAGGRDAPYESRAACCIAYLTAGKRVHIIARDESGGSATIGTAILNVTPMWLS